MPSSSPNSGADALEISRLGRCDDAAGAANGEIGRWDVATGQLTTTLAQGWVVSLAFSLDGKMLAVGDNVGEVGLAYCDANRVLCHV